MRWAILVVAAVGCGTEGEGSTGRDGKMIDGDAYLGSDGSGDGSLGDPGSHAPDGDDGATGDVQQGDPIIAHGDNTGGDTPGQGDGDSGDEPWQMPLRSTCDGTYEAPAPTGNVATDITEASGIVASPTTPGVLWIHNDSGNGRNIYAVSDSGTVLGAVELPYSADDPEDIAAAPCPDGLGPCLWLADIGNNGGGRSDLEIIAVVEPLVIADVPFDTVVATQTWHFPLTYPEDNPDAEALVVMPDLSAAYIIEKAQASTARVFAYDGPFDAAAEPQTLRLVSTMDSPGTNFLVGNLGYAITGADLHPAGQRMVLRVYTGVFEYRFPEGVGPEGIASTPATTVAWGPLSEQQGETVAYDGVGTGLWTMSEGADQPLHFYACP